MDPKTIGAKCYDCSLANQPFVPSLIRPGAQVMCVGEAPGLQETFAKEPFVGESGKLLNAALSVQGHSRDEVSLTNAVLCRPPGNAEPSQNDISCCHTRLMLEIEGAAPKTVLLMGKTAREAVLGESASAERGLWAKLRDGTTNVLVTWHPAYVLRKPSEATGFLRDIRSSFEGLKEHRVQRAPECRIAKSYEHLAQMLSECPDNAWVAYDLETNQTTWYDRPSRKAYAILMMALTWDVGMAIVINDELLYDDLRTRELLQEFFKRVRPVGHNVKFDNMFLRAQVGCTIEAQADTMLAHYLLDENSKHGLKILAWEEFGLPDYEADLVQAHLRSRSDEYSKVPFNDLAQYGSWDVAVTLALQETLEPRLISEDMLEWPYNKIIMRAQEAFTKASLHGVLVDIPYLQTCGELFIQRLIEIQRKAGSLVGKPDINLNSPPQVAEVLWDQLKLPQKHDRRVKPRSTAEPAVQHLRGKHPFVDMLLYYRSTAKLKSSYVDNMIEFADVYNRIHPDALLYGTEMGRISMRDPAVQTIPRPADKKAPDYDVYMDGALIRGAVIAPPGRKIIVSDYSQAELRVLACLSRDPFLLQVYKDGRDLHTEVTAAMFGPEWTKEQRVKCKMFNFSYVYGGTEHSFAESAGLPIAEAIAFVRKYDSVMPVAKAWKKSMFDQLKIDGYVQSFFHRRRRFPLITPENADDARKACVHGPVAATASDLTLLALCQLSEEGHEILFPVHDSILLEADENIAEELGRHVADVMRQVAETHLPEVPWKTDVDVDDSWVTRPELSQLEGAYT